MKLPTVVLAGLGLSLLAGQASADVIYGATAVSSNQYNAYYGAENLVNQSGLSQSYTNGVTDFATFASANPTHTGSSYSNGFLAPTPGFAIFDLGVTRSLTRLALWNDQDFQAVKDFNLLISDSLDFTGAALLGSFTASFVYQSYSIPTAMQVFDLAEASGRYVRVNFLNAYDGGAVNPGEIAFIGGSATNVPEPGTMALLGLGLAGIGALRRRPSAIAA